MKRILVIDDNEQIRNVMEIMLTRAGYEVVLAANGNLGIKE
jgi:CheY-like chemotaxis protein